MDLISTDSIRLTVPTSSAAVRIARAAAAGLATRAGFTYHEVEQVRLAVGEATALLALGPEGDGALSLTFDVEPDGLRVDIHVVDASSGRPPVGGPRGTLPEIAAAVLDAAVDRWEVAENGNGLVLDKRLSPSDADDDDD